jgi:hypothetical protein
MAIKAGPVQGSKGSLHVGGSFGTISSTKVNRKNFPTVGKPKGAPMPKPAANPKGNPRMPHS